MDNLNVFFFGDSIFLGQKMPVNIGFVNHISKSLYELGLKYNTNVIVTNSSVNGNTTRLALERIPYDIQAHNPDVLVIQFGMNDCNCWQTDKGVSRVIESSFASNLKEIIIRATTFGVRDIFVATNHPTTLDKVIMPYTDITYQENNHKYNDIIREISDDMGVNLIDIEKYFEDEINNGEILSNLILSDGIHLSKAGHDLYYESIYPRIDESVKCLLKEKSGIIRR
jgi:acyl-CoA thioesterase I